MIKYIKYSQKKVDFSSLWSNEKYMFKDKNFLMGLVLGMLLGIVAGVLLFGSSRVRVETQALTPIQGANLSGQNGSAQDGVAILTEESGGVRVRLSVANSPKDIPQPAHIHIGSCPNPGEVKYALSPVVNGFSETILPVTFAQMEIVPALAINVHKSADEVKTYVSCGDLSM
jgi:hypothetical protein